MQTMKTRYVVPALLFCMLLALAGCAATSTAGPQVFLRPEFHPAYIRKVAVLPFEDNTKNPDIAANCRQVTITQILSSGLFDAVDQMQVDSVLMQEAVKQGEPINAMTLRRLGQLLHVQAFLLGTLDEADQQQKGAASFLNMTLTLRLIDSESGLVLWQASGNDSGYSFWDRLFGVGGKDPYQVTVDLVQRLLATIGRPAKGKAGPSTKAKS